ncbi:MAG: hypothetical protein MHM6MM_007172 [Cercozoa sp. M6MM]
MADSGARRQCECERLRQELQATLRDARALAQKHIKLREREEQLRSENAELRSTVKLLQSALASANADLARALPLSSLSDTTSTPIATRTTAPMFNNKGGGLVRDAVLRVSEPTHFAAPEHVEPIAVTTRPPRRRSIVETLFGSGKSRHRRRRSVARTVKTPVDACAGESKRRGPVLMTPEEAKRVLGVAGTDSADGKNDSKDNSDNKVAVDGTDDDDDDIDVVPTRSELATIMAQASENGMAGSAGARRPRSSWLRRRRSLPVNARVPVPVPVA